MSAPLRVCRSAGTLAPGLAIYAATALAMVASSTFSTPELSAHCSRLAPSPPPPALAAAPARLPPLGLPKRLGREWNPAPWLGPGSATPALTAGPGALNIIMRAHLSALSAGIDKFKFAPLQIAKLKFLVLNYKYAAQNLELVKVCLLAQILCCFGNVLSVSSLICCLRYKMYS